MKVRASIAIFLVLAVLQISSATPLSAAESQDGPVATIAELEKEARARVGAKPRAELAAETSELFKDVESMESPDSNHIPNYLRAVAARPDAVKPLAHLVKTFLYSGEVRPEVKMGMGLRIAQIQNSPYVAAHMQRLLRASAHGQEVLQAIRSGNFDGMTPADHLALSYATLLTGDVHGVSDSDFQNVRGYFNDAQVVELTMTVCFFNYFTRFSEGLDLPVEPWVLDSSAKPQGESYQAPIARVALISDVEMDATSSTQANMKEAKAQSNGLGLGFANSMRAMLRAPELAQAWMAYGFGIRKNAAVGRDVLLQVSFAVSMANGCRYCTLHQVLGLHRLGVDPAKLLAMQKTDDVLTSRERVAVLFARKLTRAPASVTDDDYAKVRAEFGTDGALDVLLQTCTFAFMNRFTDGLHLPSEDEAIRVYREVYGSDWKQQVRQGN